MKLKTHSLLFIVFILLATSQAYAENSKMGDIQLLRQKIENMGLVSNYDSNDNEKKIIAHKLKKSEVSRRISDKVARQKKANSSSNDSQDLIIDEFSCSTCVTE